MGDRVRGSIAVLVGLFALYQSYVLDLAGRTDWHLWVELLAGSLLIVIGVWRLVRKPHYLSDERLR